MIMWCPFIMSFSGVWVFVSKRKHLLITLLSLEYVVLGLFLLMGLWLGGLVGESFIMLVFLTFAACEGSVGLGILVSLIRSHGNDNFGSFSVLQC